MRNVLLTLLLLITTNLSLFAQKLTIESFDLNLEDKTAQQHLCKDLNGRNCALVKVKCELREMQFEGSIVGNVENKNGEYWIFMPQGNRMLKVKHPNYAPVMVTFADYGVEKLESCRTYELTVGATPSYTKAHNTTDSLILIPVKDGISIEMVRVESGSFMMGATQNMEESHESAKPAHIVTLTNDYYIGKYEVTQALWQTVMGYNPSEFKGESLPVENVSWDDCQAFVNQLNKMTGKEFRLPTEAEWEFAARGGNKSKGYKYSGSNDIVDVAWYEGNSGGKTNAVGTKQANELGLYDMTGNVWEWCQGWYYAYSNSPKNNPAGGKYPTDRVHRGGGWFDDVESSLLCYRMVGTSSFSAYMIGLRLVLSE